MVKRITIEQLAEMTNKQFDMVEKRFDRVEKRFDKVATKEEMQNGFKEINENVKDTLESIIEAIDNLGGRIDDVKQSTVSVLDYVRLEQRVEVLEDEFHETKKNHAGVSGRK